MMTNENLVRLGGVVQLEILLASVQVPKMLNWRGELANLAPFLRRLFYVYGAFIILTIVGMGVISIAFAAEIAASPGLGRAFAGFLFVFWSARLVVQFFVFDAQPILTTPVMRFAYHALTVAFVMLVGIYGIVSFGVR
jgi:hypothetical protein